MLFLLQRIKFKKKIRILNTKLTEEKNETSVRALELKEEMEALRERNAKLEGKYGILITSKITDTCHNNGFNSSF